MPDTAWVVQSPAEKRCPGETSCVLISFPSAGCGACFFGGWGARLPRCIDMWPVELPGRNTRVKDAKPPANLQALVRAAADGLQPELVKQQLPYALLGHSFGAWLAYELALELRRRGCGEPVKLYASGNRAPSLADGAHDPDPNGPSLCTLPPAQFWPRFEQRYGANPDIQSPAVRAFLYPLLLADFACIESYKFCADEPPLRCPISAIGAHGDARYRPDQISSWKNHTSGSFEERWFTATPVHSWSTPHRYLADDPSAFQAWLGADLMQQLASTDHAPVGRI